jgi:NAD(P)-dependent dehydrogenase (short-subunit alcohol dehydrogenase family)
MQIDLSGKRAVVTGSTAGIGLSAVSTHETDLVG